MKQFLIAIILLLVLCMIPIAYAQEKIQVYEREFPTSMADLGIHGPVKMVKGTISAPNNGVLEEQLCYTDYYDPQGLSTKTVSYDCMADAMIEFHYTYDSLGHFISKATADGKFLQEAVYDSLGRFIYSVYTRDDGNSKPSFRYFYDEKYKLLDCVTSYDEKGNMTSWIYFRYDEYHNCIEAIYFSLRDNSLPELIGKYTHEYEYYE